MKPMKVVLTEQLDDKVRRKAAALKGLRKGALSEVVSEALENWVGGEPELYVGVFEDGMSLELPSRIVPGFLEILAETLRPGKIRIHARVDGEEITREIPSKHLLVALREAGISPLGSDFMAEMGEVRLFTGGGGCISIEGSIPAKMRLQILRSLLSKTGVRGALPRKMPLHLQVREGRVEILQTRQVTLRAAGHFRVLVDHSLRPYEPNPSHILKRMLLPLCEDLQYVLAEGTKNDAWELLESFSQACKRIPEKK